MKKAIIISLICLISISCFGQKEKGTKNMYPQGRIDLPDKGHFGFGDVNDSDFIRILDGLRLGNEQQVPKGLSINKIWKLSDSMKLAEIGLPYTGKPYMILNTSINKIRQYIKDKADIPYNVYERNLPVILNGNLITPDQTARLNDLDTNTVRSIKFVKEVSTEKSHGYEMPWGAIFIQTKE